MKRIATLLALTLMTACSSQLVETGAGGSSGTGAGGNGGAGGTTTPPDWAAALCNASGGNELTFQDVAHAQAHLVGSWILCRQPGLSWATEQPDQGGIELGPDMAWRLLRWVGGALTRADGFQASGTYRFNAPQDLMFMPANAVTLFFGLDYSFVDATMLDVPQKMRWNNNSIYVRVPDNTN
jgi:hypothetical protein